MNFTVALLRGDGIGPEIVDSAVRVLDVIAEKYNHTFDYKPYLIGGAAIDATGAPLPQETVDEIPEEAVSDIVEEENTNE